MVTTGDHVTSPSGIEYTILSGDGEGWWRIGWDGDNIRIVSTIAWLDFKIWSLTHSC